MMSCRDGRYRGDVGIYGYVEVLGFIWSGRDTKVIRIIDGHVGM